MTLQLTFENSKQEEIFFVSGMVFQIVSQKRNLGLPYETD